MALTSTEQKKMAKIEKELQAKQQERDALIKKSCQDFSKQAMKYNLWKLDKKMTEAELKAMAEKYKTL